MSEPITLTEREREIIAAIAYKLLDYGRIETESVGGAIIDWLANHPTESASPPRVPGSSAQIPQVGVESGPGQPTDYERGYRAGVEAAAKWHDGQHREWDAETGAVEQEREWSLYLHRDAAAAIRALADKPAPDPLLPGLSASVGGDGCWLHFRTTDGNRSASFHIANKFNGDSFMDKTVRQWCSEREAARKGG